jgi:hypothetical protein
MDYQDNPNCSTPSHGINILPRPGFKPVTEQEVLSNNSPHYSKAKESLAHAMFFAM